MIEGFNCVERKSGADIEYRVQHPIKVDPGSRYFLNEQKNGYPAEDGRATTKMVWNWRRCPGISKRESTEAYDENTENSESTPIVTVTEAVFETASIKRERILHCDCPESLAVSSAPVAPWWANGRRPLSARSAT